MLVSNRPRVTGESKIGGRTGNERAVSGVERFAGVDPPHPVHRQLHRTHDALDREVRRHQRGVRAGRERGLEVPRVVMVVVREEDPAHVVGLDDRERGLHPLGA